ncbi:unnamed protein product [Xylocopa violacea]|uniref:Uncharacterized protein n=1 Tax=Xylocopa violacea TaxID=135666 RepID=A0ABP1NU27_XYLVO
MDLTNSSRYSPSSTFSYEESNSEVDLNKAILLSNDESILSHFSDEILYDTNGFSFSSSNIETDAKSFACSAEENKDLSHPFHLNDSTQYMCLPSRRNRSNYKNNKSTIMQNLNNLQCQNLITTIEEYQETNKYIPLRVQLKQIFDEMLRKCNNITKESSTRYSNKSSTSEFSRLKCSNESSISEFSSTRCSNKCSTSGFSLSSSSLSTNNLDNTSEINNINLLCQTEEPDRIIATSTENLQNTNKSNNMSSHNTSIYCFARRLVTILEDSYESSSNSQLENSCDWTGRCIARLNNFTIKKLENKYCTDERIFITSDISDSDSTMSSHFSSDMETLGREIFQKANRS